MVTRRGACLLVGAVALWAVGRFLGVAELYVVAAATAALVAVGALAVRLSTSTISVRRRVAPARIPGGGQGEVTVELRNDARVPAAVLLVEDTCHHVLSDPPRFVVTGLGAGRATSVRYALQGAARGRYVIGPLRVRVRDPFGVAQRIRRYRGTDDVVVYPRIEPLGGPASPGTPRGSGSSDTRRLFNTGDEFYTMREYVLGDDLRQVHWPSTARRQTLMVRQQEQPWQAEATVFCDTRLVAHRDVGPSSSLEKAVSVAASLVWHLADEGFRLRLVTETDIRPDLTRRTQPWELLLDRLAELAPSRAASLAPALQRLRAAGGEGLLAAVVAPPPGDEPVARHPDVRALLATGRAYGGRVALVVDPGRQARDRATDLAGVLRAAGWRATTISPSQPLAERWRPLTGTRGRALAFEPGAAG